MQPFLLIVILLAGATLMFLIAPLISLLMGSRLERLFETAVDADFRESLWLTFGAAGAATLIGSLGAVPLAWILARYSFPLKNSIIAVIDLPIVIPHTAAGVALLGVISRDSFLGKMASTIGLNFIGNPLGISMALAFVSLPFLISAARRGFEAVPRKLEQAAALLGASPTQILFKISIPLAKRPILGGMVLMFARGISEFGAVIIIAYHPMITPVFLYDRLNTMGLEYATPVAVLLVLVTLLIFGLSRVLTKNLLNAGNQRY